MDGSPHLQSVGSALDAPDPRARLAAPNALELLLLALGTTELFAINVCRVREITRTPRITRAPNLPAGVEGVVSLRGSIIPVFSLAKLLRVPQGACSDATMIVTEFNRRVQGFLVDRVERIARVDWRDVHAPAALLDDAETCISAVTARSDGKLVSVLDVEHVLAAVYGETPIPELEPIVAGDAMVFFADDSSVARREIGRVLDRLALRHQHATNGREAWERLHALAERADIERHPLSHRLAAILADAEMPELDGYGLARRVKQDARFAGVPVILHSSLSSEANRALGAQAGVDAYVPKFDPRVLAETLRPLIQQAASPAASPEVNHV